MPLSPAFQSPEKLSAWLLERLPEEARPDCDVIEAVKKVTLDAFGKGFSGAFHADNFHSPGDILQPLARARTLFKSLVKSERFCLIRTIFEGHTSLYHFLQYASEDSFRELRGYLAPLKTLKRLTFLARAQKLADESGLNIINIIEFLHKTQYLSTQDQEAVIKSARDIYSLYELTSNLNQLPLETRAPVLQLVRKSVNTHLTLFTLMNTLVLFLAPEDRKRTAPWMSAAFDLKTSFHNLIKPFQFDEQLIALNQVSEHQSTEEKEKLWIRAVKLCGYVTDRVELAQALENSQKLSEKVFEFVVTHKVSPADKALEWADMCESQLGDIPKVVAEVGLSIATILRSYSVLQNWPDCDYLIEAFGDNETDIQKALNYLIRIEDHTIRAGLLKCAVISNSHQTNKIKTRDALLDVIRAYITDEGVSKLIPLITVLKPPPAYSKDRMQIEDAIDILTEKLEAPLEADDIKVLLDAAKILERQQATGWEKIRSATKILAQKPDAAQTTEETSIISGAIEILGNAKRNIESQLNKNITNIKKAAEIPIKHQKTALDAWQSCGFDTAPAKHVLRLIQALPKCTNQAPLYAALANLPPEDRITFGYALANEIRNPKIYTQLIKIMAPSSIAARRALIYELKFDSPAAKLIPGLICALRFYDPELNQSLLFDVEYHPGRLKWLVDKLLKIPTRTEIRRVLTASKCVCNLITAPTEHPASFWSLVFTLSAGKQAAFQLVNLTSIHDLVDWCSGHLETYSSSQIEARFFAQQVDNLRKGYRSFRRSPNFEQLDPLLGYVLHISSNAPGSSNPWTRFHEPNQIFEIKTPYQSLCGVQTALNPSGFCEGARQYVVTRNSIPKGIHKDSWRERCSPILAKEVGELKRVCQRFGSSWERVKTPMTLASIHQLLDFEDGEITVLKLQFACIVNYLNTQPDEVVLMVADSIQYCKSGREEGIALYYNQLPAEFKYTQKGRASKSPDMDKGYEFIAHEMQAFLEKVINDPAFLADLCGTATAPRQEVHHIQFARNILASYIGLQNSRSFDIHLHAVTRRLLERSHEEIVDIFYQHATPQKLVEHLQNAFEQTKGDKRLSIYNQLRKLTTNSIWALKEGEDDFDLTNLMLSEDGARQLITAAGYFKESCLSPPVIAGGPSEGTMPPRVESESVLQPIAKVIQPVPEVVQPEHQLEEPDVEAIE